MEAIVRVTGYWECHCDENFVHENADVRCERCKVAYGDISTDDAEAVAVIAYLRKRLEGCRGSNFEILFHDADNRAKGLEAQLRTANAAIDELNRRVAQWEDTWNKEYQKNTELARQLSQAQSDIEVYMDALRAMRARRDTG